MKRLAVLVLLVLIAVAIPLSAVYGQREEIRLTTIIPDQSTLRVKKGVIGGNYSGWTKPPDKKVLDADLPADGLIVEGNVGIGTTNPGGILHVTKNAPHPEFSAVVFANTGIGSSGVEIRTAAVNTAQGGYPYLDFTRGSTNDDSGGTPDGTARIWNEMDGTNKLFFGLNYPNTTRPDQAKVTIQENGSVGIGTTSPAASLHIYEGNGLYLDAGTSDGTQFNFITLGDGKTGLQNAGTKGWHIYARGNAYVSMPNQQNDLGFTYYDGTTGLHTVFHLDSVMGNVGIGTANPDATLEVKGTMKVFGAWEPKSKDTVYRAATDGFVSAIGTASTGFTDSNNPPTTQRTSSSQFDGQCFMPVRKDDYWKITGDAHTVYWIPLGS